MAARLGWVVVAVFTEEGVFGAKGRDKRPGYDSLVKGIARREFDLVAAWSVCRLGRSLQDLVVFLDVARSCSLARSLGPPLAYAEPKRSQEPMACSKISRRCGLSRCSMR